MIHLFNNDSKSFGAAQVNCSDQFVLKNGTCQPLCDKMMLFSKDLSDIDFVIEILAAFAGGIFGVLLIASIYIWRKKM